MITVIAGPNGGGKSTVAGKWLTRAGAYFNPDEFTSWLVAERPDLAPNRANSIAWHEGVQRLRQAIAADDHFAFETTLGGTTIPAILQDAASAGRDVRIWFVALETPELHVARVRARVNAGGHDIPEDKIRARYESSRLNLIRLIPVLTRLRVSDNSQDAYEAGPAATTRTLLTMAGGRVLSMEEAGRMPAWAKPIAAAALHHAARMRRG